MFQKMQDRVVEDVGEDGADQDRADRDEDALPKLFEMLNDGHPTVGGGLPSPHPDHGAATALAIPGFSARRIGGWFGRLLDAGADFIGQAFRGVAELTD